MWSVKKLYVLSKILATTNNKICIAEYCITFWELLCFYGSLCCEARGWDVISSEKAIWAFPRCHSRPLRGQATWNEVHVAKSNSFSSLNDGRHGVCDCTTSACSTVLMQRGVLDRRAGSRAARRFSRRPLPLLRVRFAVMSLSVCRGDGDLLAGLRRIVTRSKVLDSFWSGIALN